MPVVKVAPDVYWVGVVDWNIRTFHGHTYSTPRGTTYNAYLIMDEKVTLVDGVYGPFAEELIEKIRQIVPPEKIDYIIANHVEPDHSGAYSHVLKHCPKAKMFGTAKCQEGLQRYYYGNWDFQVVKTGDKLKIGKRTLQFIEAPMIHWPDSMFTYCPEEQLLLSNDAFGQHYATSERFDDEVDEHTLMEEAAKYFANILWPLGAVIAKKLDEIQAMNIPIKTIAPSHGIIWRKDPMKVVKAYRSWTANVCQPKVVVVYETMWGATEKMARQIVEALSDSGISVKLFDVAVTDRTEIIYEMFSAKGYLVGSSTHDNDLLPTIAGFLEFLKGLKPKNRVGAVFGSQGWAGGALQRIESILKEGGITISQPFCGLKYMPSHDELKRVWDWAKDFAKVVKG